MKYIVIDIGGTRLKHGVIDSNAKFIEEDNIPSQANLGGEYLVSIVTNICQEYIKKYDIKAVGISTAGMVDPNKGEIIYAGKQIPNYVGINWKKIIFDKFGIKCEVENDVNCAGLSEYTFGAGKNYNSVVCLTIGTGIGACMVKDGEIYHGANNSAFEIGYMNMGNGMYQDIASTTALIENVSSRKKINKEDIDGHIIFRDAKNGDIICNEEINNLLFNIASGISNICYVVNPEVVILGGGIMEQKEFLLPKLEIALEKTLIPYIREKTKFEFAENGNRAGMLGAFINLINKL